MFEKTRNLFSKTYEIVEGRLDEYILKARASSFDNLEKYAIDFEEDENSLGSAQGWLEKYSYINFDFLYQMSVNSVFTAILLRRVNEIASFAHPQRNKYEPGYMIKKRDEKEEVNDKEQSEIKELEEFIFNTGMEEGRSKITRNPKNFEEWVRLTIRDRLIYNMLATERVFKQVQKKEDKLPGLHSFYHVPSHSIRYAVNTSDDSNLGDAKKIKEQIKASMLDNVFTNNPSTRTEIQKRITAEDIWYVQLHHQRIINVFNNEQLVVKQGNLNAELDNNGYSQGELELAVNLISAHVFTETHNRLYFTQGFSNKGILVIKQSMNRKVMERFKQQFRQQMQGTANAFRVPILSGTDVSWVPLQANMKDMEWEKWTNYLIKLITAIFQMSPQEINFDISKEGSGLGDSGERQKSIIAHFKETGVQPLLRWLEGVINKEIVRYYNEDYYAKYVFRFVGIDNEQEKEEVERLTKEVQFYKTVNEVRKERDLEELSEGGDIILSQVYLQAQQFAEMGEGGFDGEGPVDQSEKQSSSDKTPEMKDVMSQDPGKAKKAVKKSVASLSNKLHKVEWYNK